MLGTTVDIGDQRFQFVFKLYVIVGASQSSLVAELKKCDAAHSARPLIQYRQFAGGVADTQRAGKITGSGAAFLRLLGPASIWPIRLIQL